MPAFLLPLIRPVKLTDTVGFQQKCQIYFITSIVRSLFWGEDVFIADIGNQ